MSQPLKELTWVPYLDTQACPDPIEDEASSYHLCTALRKHSKSLISLRMKPIKICSCFFKDSEWPDLQELNIDLLEFKACNGKEKEHEVQESLESAVAPYLGAPVSRFTRLRTFKHLSKIIKKASLIILRSSSSHIQPLQRKLIGFVCTFKFGRSSFPLHLWRLRRCFMLHRKGIDKKHLAGYFRVEICGLSVYHSDV